MKIPRTRNELQNFRKTETDFPDILKNTAENSRNFDGDRQTGKIAVNENLFEHMWIDCSTRLAIMFSYPVLIYTVKRTPFCAVQRAAFAARVRGQPTEKVLDVIKWLDSEGIKPYVIKKGVFTDNYSGVNVHLKNSFCMSILTEDAVTMGMFAETAIFKEDKECLIQDAALGYEMETMRHSNMQELGEQIGKVKAAADKGELSDQVCVREAVTMIQMSDM